MNKIMKTMYGILGLLFLLIVYLATLWTDRSLEFILTYFKGTEIEIPFWLSLICTFILNGFSIIFNIVIELFRFIL